MTEETKEIYVWNGKKKQLATRKQLIEMYNVRSEWIPTKEVKIKDLCTGDIVVKHNNYGLQRYYEVKVKYTLLHRHERMYFGGYVYCAERSEGDREVTILN